MASAWWSAGAEKTSHPAATSSPTVTRLSSGARDGTRRCMATSHRAVPAGMEDGPVRSGRAVFPRPIVRVTPVRTGKVDARAPSRVFRETNPEVTKEVGTGRGWPAADQPVANRWLASDPWRRDRRGENDGRGAGRRAGSDRADRPESVDVQAEQVPPDRGVALADQRRGGGIA